MKIALIRHGKTVGNIKKVYLGRTDENLSKEGITEILSKKPYPNFIFAYTSPMKRCVETLKLINENADFAIINDLIECNFGDFEYKTYDELKENIDYQNWINSNGEIAFPKGESKSDFSNRTCIGFEKIIKDAMKKKLESIAIICHGGSIMSIMEKYENSQQSFYNWQVKNGEGYLLDLDENIWTEKKKINLINFIK